MNEALKLYRVSSTGKMLVWSCWSEGKDVVSASGELEGKLTPHRYTAEAKNVGRANETTAEEQAQIEVITSYTHQKDNKHYRYSQEEAVVVHENNRIPRKLHNYKKFEHKLPEACYSLVKYDGSRACVVEGSLYSKIGRKEEIKVAHLRRAVEEMDTYGLANFDAEVYAHGLSLQRIRSAWLKPVKTDKEIIKMANDRMKKKGNDLKCGDLGAAVAVLGYNPNDDALKLRFYIFDIPVLGVPFKERRATLRKVFPSMDTLAPDCFKLATAYLTGSSKGRLSLRNDVVLAKYEGLVHISPEDMYSFDEKVYTALKDKPRYDAEALVTGVVKDKAGNGTLILKAADVLDNVEFKCVMKVDRRDGKSYPKDYESMIALVGSWITFSYEDLSDSGKPTKPVGELVRVCNAAGEPLE